MELQTLKKLVAQGEGSQIEFKRKANFPDKIMKEISAFANTNGGILFIGVDDDGTLAGLKYAEEDEFELKKTIEKYCRPMVEYRIEKIKIALNRVVLAFFIEASKTKPIFVIYNFKSNRGRAYVRRADRSIQASREMRQILKAQHQTENVLFTYGIYEQMLMRLLAEQTKTSVKTFAQYANIADKDASAILVKLTLAGVLVIEAQEDFDFFYRKEDKP